ncbi:hypothetical protein [Brachyspira aalborgi]|nr:hypothetical protein [Brachyspira aalborgi]
MPKSFGILSAEKILNNDILLCFEEVGIEMREEIDEYFSKFKDM